MVLKVTRLRPLKDMENGEFEDYGKWDVTSIDTLDWIGFINKKSSEKNKMNRVGLCVEATLTRTELN